MVWNIFIHVGLGVFGYNIFRLDGMGIATCVGIAAIVQGFGTYRFLQYAKQRFEGSSAGETQDWQGLSASSNFKAKIVQLYLAKLVIYSGVTLAVAAVTRSVIA